MRRSGGSPTRSGSVTKARMVAWLSGSDHTTHRNADLFQSASHAAVTTRALSRPGTSVSG